MRSFAIVLLATAVLAAKEGDPKKHDKRSLLTGIPDVGISNYGIGSLGLSGYSLPIGSVPSTISVGNSLASAYASGLGYGNTYGSYGSYGLGSSGVIIDGHPTGLGVGSIGVVPSVAHAKTERITGVTLHREVQVPVPVPHPVPVEVTKHVPVPHPVPVKVDRPYPVPVAQPVPVPVTRHVPVKVDRPYPVAVPHPVEVRVPQPVPVPVAQPVPVPVSVTKHVPISVPSVRVLPAVNVVPSTVGVLPSSVGVLPSSVGVLPSSVGVLPTPFGIPTGISSGHEYVDLGSSGLAPISGTTLTGLAPISGTTLNGLAPISGTTLTGLGTGFSSLDNGHLVSGGLLSSASGVEHISTGLGSTLGSTGTVLTPHGTLDGGYALKKW